MPPDEKTGLGGAETLEAATADETPRARRRATLLRGQSIGRYMVIDRIGAGGMGVVYSAFDPELGRRVAIKVVATGEGADASKSRQRRLREAQAMAQVSHPNVIAVHDVGTVDSDVFIAMELRAGTTLTDWLEKAPRTWRDILPIFVQAGRGLEAAHRAGLVHRDFKPDNVHVGDDGRVCVLDLGLARPSGDASPSGELAPGAAYLDAPGGSPLLSTPLTEVGVRVGTPQYMAPEQHRGGPTDGRTDQFGFCVALHEALYGERPFEGSTVAALAANVTAGRIRQPPKDRDVPGWLRAAILRGLSVAPGDRFPSLNALLAAIDRQAARRRGTAIVVGGLVILTAVGVVIARPSGGGAPVCRGALEKIAATWTQPRKDALRARFEGTGLPFARDTAARTLSLLDEWSARWAKVRTESCEATHVRGEQSEELLALQMQCLDRREVELDALITVLAQADGKVVEEAVPAVGKLASPDGCRDTRSLSAPPRPPDGSQAAIGSISRQLAQAKALDSAGRYADARVPAGAANQAADRLGYPPLVAEARYLAARIDSSLGDGEGAERSYQSAIQACIEGRTDELGARAAVEYAMVLGSERHKPAEARQAAALASALIGRIGRPEGLAGELDTAMGVIYRSEGKLDEAKAAFERAIPALERAYGPRSSQVVRVYNQLGILLYTAGHYAEAAGAFERVRAIREREHGADHPQVGNILVNLGVIYTHLGRHAEGMAALERARAILEPKLGPQHVTLAKIHNNMGLLLAREGRYQEALVLHERALAMFEKLPGMTEVDSAATRINLALANRNLGRCDVALEIDRRVLAIYEKAYGPKHPDLAYPLIEMGHCLVTQGRPGEAIGPLLRARAVREGQDEDVAERAENELALAKALWESGRDRKQAIAQATLASGDYAQAEKQNPTMAKERAEAEAWLAGHPAP